MFQGGFVSCKKQENESETIQAVSGEATKTFLADHAHYAFSKTGLFAFEDFSQLEVPVFEPYTEMPSATALTLQFSTPLVLINKLGVLTFENYLEPRLCIVPLLETVSAQDFFSTTEGLLFRVFRNELFNSSYNPFSQAQPFLCKYNPLSEQASVVLTTIDVGALDKAQSTHLQQYHGLYLASFKTESPNSVEFEYFEADSLNLSKLNFKTISAETFQAKTQFQTIKPKNEASELESLLATFLTQLESESEVVISVFSPDFDSKKTFKLSNATTSTPQEITCTSIYKDNTLFVLLPNGTFYKVAKALVGETAKVSVEVTELSKLPSHFVYTYFAFDDETFVVFWEEQDFFRLGRTGFTAFNAKSFEHFLKLK